MTSRDFCYWLQGFLEIGDPVTLTADQVDMVKRHLAMAFKHEIDPSFGGPEKQGPLNHLHGTGPTTMRC